LPLDSGLSDEFGYPEQGQRGPDFAVMARQLRNAEVLAAL